MLRPLAASSSALELRSRPIDEFLHSLIFVSFPTRLEERSRLDDRALSLGLGLFSYTVVLRVSYYELGLAFFLAEKSV